MWEERMNSDGADTYDDVSFPVAQRSFAARVTLYAYLSYPCICMDPEKCVSYGEEDNAYGQQLDDMISLAQNTPSKWEMNLNKISFQNYGILNPFVVSKTCRDLLKTRDSSLRMLLHKRIYGTDLASRAVFTELSQREKQ